jgi:hypothetical protein
MQGKAGLLGSCAAVGFGLGKSVAKLQLSAALRLCSSAQLGARLAALRLIARL